MTETENSKRYDLEERTFLFAHQESKESRYWLKLVSTDSGELEQERQMLIQEATELMNIFGAILKSREGRF